ncbi:MAG: four helix bundle protein [Cytophagia bacterium]|nr:four helix bundle protein [Cytophagia bacterium]
MRTDRKNLIIDLTFNFALQVIDYVETLNKEGKQVVPLQLLKSGTSVGANVWEAQNAESKKDFVHKLKIAAKEADESQYWLKLCQASIHYPDPKNLTADLTSISKVLSRIISSSKSSNQHISKSSN